jgi:hypothetical protein
VKHAALLTLAILLLAAPASASKIFIDYDKEYDRTAVRTFAWSDSPETSLEESDGLLHSRIIEAIEYYLAMGGLIEDDESPDVFVTYHVDSRKELQLDTNNWGYRYPSGWYAPHSRGYYGGSHSTTTSVTEYTKGTIVVDVWDAHTNTLVWRGTAAEIYVPKNPQKLAKKIDKALAKMSKRWHKTKVRDAKGG